MRKTVLVLLTLIIMIQSVAAADWAVTVINDPGVPSPPMQVFVNGNLQGTGNLIQINHFVTNGTSNSWPEVAALYSSGYLRLKPNTIPDRNFSSSFVLGPGYWSNNTYYHNPTLNKTYITGNLNNGNSLSFSIEGRNNAFATNHSFILTPGSQKTTALVTQNIKALNNVILDPARIRGGEAFKIAQISSMYIDEYYNDAQFLKYKKNGQNFTIPLRNENGFILPSAQTVDNQEAFLIKNTTGWQGITPSVRMRILNAKKIVLQGHVTNTSNYNDDNVGVWLNDQSMRTLAKIIPAGFTKNVSYQLEAYF